jgi:anti-anti-sigma regulatory factor
LEGITQETRGDVIINKVNLSRATVNEASELQNLLDEQISVGHSKIVVDLSQCTHLDTVLVGRLVATHKKLLAKGDELYIVSTLGPSKELLFQITAISRVINIFETTEDAIKSFSNRRVAWEFSKSFSK